MRFRRYLLGIALLAAVACIAVFMFYGQLVVYLVASTNNLDISYGKILNAGPGRFLFEGLTIIEKKSSLGLFAETATVDIALKGIDVGSAVTDFDLRQVHFLKTPVETPQSLTNIDGMIAAPFSSQWTYEAISGRVFTVPDGLRIENLMATSSELKMSFTGTLRDDNTISSDVTIYFADSLTRKIPPEFTAMVLKNEDGGWKSLSVNLQGDYVKPSIQVTGRLFRLTIGLKE